MTLTKDWLSSPAARMEIDLVILDIIMPKMSGPQVFERIRVRRNTLPVILTSGYTDESLEELLKLPAVRFLQKPYRRDELAALVSELGRIPPQTPRPRTET